jgi:hypothetical protein
MHNEFVKRTKLNHLQKSSDFIALWIRIFKDPNDLSDLDPEFEASGADPSPYQDS